MMPSRIYIREGETCSVLLIKFCLVGRRGRGESHRLRERQTLHRQAEWISGGRDHRSGGHLSVSASSEEHLWACASSDGATHVSRQERQPDLIRSIHPTETFTRNHLEIDALVPVFRVDQMRELDSVKLQEPTLRSEVSHIQG